MMQQKEGFEAADKIVIIANGAIQQIGSPEEVRANPANAFVEDFLEPARNL